MIEFRCSKCDGVVRAPEAHAGKKGRCPTCQEIVPIPEKSERLEPVEFPCEKCGHGMKAPGKFVGRQGKCAKCGHLMTIPADSIPHGESLPMAKPVARAPGASPGQPVQAKPAQPAVAKPVQPTAPRPAQPAAAKPAQPAAVPNPFAQPQPAAPRTAVQPNPFAQPQPKPAPQANAFAQPHPAAKPIAPQANDPFADLGNFGGPAMAPMPMSSAMPAHGAYAAPAPYGATAHRPSGSSADVPGIISMILGIVSLLLMMGGCVLSCLPIVGAFFHILTFFTSVGGLITGFFGKSGFRVAGIVMNSIVLFIIVMLFVIGVIIGLTVGLSGLSQEFGDPGMQQNPWEQSYEPDFGNDF